MSKLLFTSVFAFLFSALSLFGQDASGRIIGTVTDPTGATIAGAKVVITNIATQVSRHTTSIAFH